MSHVQFALAGNESTYIFGHDRREDNGPTPELLKEQTTHCAEIHAARRRGESANMVHMVVEATQFLIYRGRSPYGFGDNRLGTQDDKQMPERCAQVTGSPVYRLGTSTLR